MFTIKKLFACLLTVILTLQLHAVENQNFSTEFGAFQNSDFDYVQYDKDTTAEAVFLYDIGHTYFTFDPDEGRFYMNFVRHYRIKIFNKSGLDWANVEIPFYINGNDWEKVTEIKGVTYNREDYMVRKTPLNPDLIYQEDKSANLKVMKFAMPDVREGSIIEVTYTVCSPYMFNFQNWNFQYSIPVIYSEYRADMIPFYKYTYLLQGANKFDAMSSYESFGSHRAAGIDYRDMVYVFVMKDVPAFRYEPFITCPKDYLIRLDFQLTESTSPYGEKTSYLSTWPKFCEDMLKNYYFGYVLKKDENMAADIVAGMKLEGKTTQEKTATIYNYVKSTVQWDGLCDKFTNMSLKDLLIKRRGNSADINLFLTAMLRKAGVDASPVLISTRDHGKFKSDYPFHFFFNYVAVASKREGGGYLMLDATEPFIGLGSLPARCINEEGLLIRNKKEYDWLSLQLNQTSTTRYSLDLKPDLTSDSVFCTICVNSNGFEGMDLRKAYLTDQSVFRAKRIPECIQLKDTIRVLDLNCAERPFEIRYKGDMEMHRQENVLSFNPFCNLVSALNPLKSEKRTYPIDRIYPVRKYYNVVLHIPDGYKMVSSFNNVHTDDDNFRLDVVSKLMEGNLLSIQAMYEFKKSIYGSELYQDVKSYYNQLCETFNNNVVLVRN